MLRKASLCPILPHALLCPTTRPVLSPLHSQEEDGTTRATPYRNLGSVPHTTLATTAPPLNLPPPPQSLAAWSMLQPEFMPRAAPWWGKSHQSPTDIIGPELTTHPHLPSHPEGGWHFHLSSEHRPCLFHSLVRMVCEMQTLALAC